MQPGIYTVPLHLPFLDALAAGLRDDAAGDPLALSRMTVLLPTRRACRALREAFLRASGGAALLLPRLMPVGDIDDDEPGFGEEDLAVPPATPELRRRLLLTRLILCWDGAGKLLPGQAAALALELARLLDEVESEGGTLDGERLAALVPADHAEHWQVVVRFLAIVVEHWPTILAEEGCIDPAARRNALVAAQAEAWRRAPPAHPVVAAGLTATMPAVAELVAAITALPQGTVVLPGLDTAADSETQAAIRVDEGHPQHGMLHLLDRLGATPDSVRPWPAPGVLGGPPERAALVAAAMRPADLTSSWRQQPLAPRPGALKHMWRLDCAGPQEEAGAIALLLRQRLEWPGQTAMLVTPDRGLARRVAAELRRWDIEIDDSAGIPLDRTPPGAFLRLLVDAATDMAPVPLLALLKHPLAGAAMEPGSMRALVREMEREALRGPRPASGLGGLRNAVAKAPARVRELVARVSAILEPLATALAAPEIGLRAILAAHVAAAEGLAASAEETGAARLWSGEAGEAAARFVAELHEVAGDFPPLRGEDWPALFETLVAARAVRPRWGRHPRLAILGLLEARLQQADLVVLGGLNEGSWPADPAADPWMSRAMRRSFGLPSPERRIGMAAHDFVQGLGAREVVLTRATRVEGTPTVPSRWLLRLEAVLEAAGVEKLRAPASVLEWQALLDRPERRLVVEPPAPRPPVAARPTRLSITQIETWMRDPYAIYAREILRLRRLEPVDADPGAAERGQFIHAALDEFVRRHPDALPADALDRILEIGRSAFGDALERPGVWAFWWPRFERVARWFLATETVRRPLLAASVTESSGKLEIGGFRLTGKADRIDRLATGELVILDYKTGGVPKLDEVERGLAPQLPLEAAIAERGGFEGVAPAPVAGLEYWRLSGGRVAGEICERAGDPARVKALADAALAGLAALVACFADPRTPYGAIVRPRPGPLYGEYLHLARVKEWLPAVETGE